ncbi:MAG: DUF4382 domain-containing protein, partial [Nevskia sp.]|nr:DUF4382 domain-containing protein [Nevskia sp.]
GAPPASPASVTPGSMRLSVGDAPVDGAEHVVVKFTGVELLNEGGTPLDISLSPARTIDLLTQGSTASAVLFDQPITPGTYSQIRLTVVADGDPSNSYIQLSDGSVHGLQVPSGSESGLKLVSGFVVPASGIADYTIDFDLRKSIVCPPGQAPTCFLKPALRLVNNGSVGNIAGSIDPGLLTAGCSPGVYLYDGTVTAPEDYNSTAPGSDTNQPIASKVPVQTSSGLLYQFTFLTPGTYSVAFTCQAASDNPDQNDHLSFTSINSGIAVAAGQTTTLNLVNNTQGTIAGTVAPSLVPQGCTPGVYLYGGTVTAPEDKNSTAPPGDTNQPLSSVVPAQTSGGLQYQFVYLAPGSYTVAYTCQAAQDNPAQNDHLSFSPVKTGIGVTAGMTTTVNLP